MNINKNSANYVLDIHTSQLSLAKKTQIKNLVFATYD